MRISDVSSDVCSSDLPVERPGQRYRLRRVLIVQPVERPAGRHRGEGEAGRELERQPQQARRAGEVVARVAALQRNVQQRLAAGLLEHHPKQDRPPGRSEEHTSELQSLMRISYAVFCLKKKNVTNPT